MKKDKKLLGFIICVLISLLMSTSIFALDNFLISLGNSESLAGETVVVPITMVDAPDFFVATIEIEYDENLMTLLSVQDTGLVNGSEHSDKYASPYTLTWVNNGEVVNNGVVAELTFRLSAAVKEDLHIKINIPRDGVIDSTGTILTPQLNNGIIYIAENHEHNYGKWTDYNSVKHMRECDCGESEYQRHSWDDGEVTKEPTVDSSGITTYTCSICSATKAEAIPPLPTPTPDNILAEGTCGDNLTWKLDKAGTLTIFGEGEMYDYAQAPWNAYNETITNLVLPNGLTYIGCSAFSYCSALTSVSIPNSVTSIGEWAFYNCTSLTTVSIPNSVTNIEYAAFYKCSSLTAVAIPNSVTSIGEYAFSDCSSLTAISIPDSITSIERDSFSGCTGLITVSIPNSVTRIGDYAFNNCTSLPAISIPDSVTSIGVQAFRTCLSLTAITIPDSVTSIGDYIFYSCPNLTTVSIPAGITSINGAFYNCTSLTSVYFHGDAPTLNTNAFLNTPSSLVLYYIAGKSGWTSPTWTDSNGVTYNTATFTPGAVDPKPTIPGDISGDGVLDYFDVTALYAAYQSGEVDTEVMDVNHDGVVDYYDVSKLYAAFRGTATLT